MPAARESGRVVKYIRFSGAKLSPPVFIDFPDYVHHQTVADALAPVLGAVVVSAGFVSDTGECFGQSDGLGVAASEGDTRLRQITMRTTIRKEGG